MTNAEVRKDVVPWRRLLRASTDAIKFAVVVSLILLASATSLAMIAALWLGPKQLVALVGWAWRLVATYGLPFVVLIGAPSYGVLAWTRLPKACSACIAVGTAVLVAHFSFPAVEQCNTSLSVRRSILRELSASDAETLVARHTPDDDSDDKRRHFPLSSYCPRYFEYRQHGEVKHASINHGMILYNDGPVQ